jgi:hypothetical protein
MWVIVFFCVSLITLSSAMCISGTALGTAVPELPTSQLSIHSEQCSKESTEADSRIQPNPDHLTDEQQE